MEIYNITNLETIKAEKANLTYVFALTDEHRSLTALENIINDVNIENVVVINYFNKKISDELACKFKNTHISYINITEDPYQFLEQISLLDIKIFELQVVFDISCVRVPEMFTMIKFIKINSTRNKISIIYSLPYDYNFSNEPFTSYRSHIGDLNTIEPIGFSGSSVMNELDSELFLFVGFEGAMSLKIIEDVAYGKIKMINTLPSFYMKYKDISVLNNLHVFQYASKMMYTPSDNPFETYNFLDNSIIKGANVCIAPLGTKAISLGICLYALDNPNVKIVYPISDSYKVNTTIDTYQTYVYPIAL